MATRPTLTPPAEMNTLGIIGGTAWRSTVEYYRRINLAINTRYRDETGPPLVIYNLNQAKVHSLQRSGDWPGVADMYVEAGWRLKAAGCSGLLLAANTAHKIFDEICYRVGIPIIHIADACAIMALRLRADTVGLIGTRFTMEDQFITGRLLNNHGLKAIVPSSPLSRKGLHNIIQDELSMGVKKQKTKRFVLDEISKLRARGAQAVILGCTEFCLMIHPEDTAVPIIDSMGLHAEAAVEFIIGRSSGQIFARHGELTAPTKEKSGL